MKTISVKQVATALDITPRAVIYRLEKKQLRGSQSPNAFGKQEWRVYPTKEIIEGLKRNSGRIEEARKEASEVGDFDFTPEDIEVVEAEGTEHGSSEDTESIGSEEEFDASPTHEPRDWQAMARATMKSMAEELVRPLGEMIKQQQEQLVEQEQQLFEKDRLLEDKERQLKLLPDFQKQAEEERKVAELKELESEALRKQIAAMESVKEQSETLRLAAEEELQRLKDEKETEAKLLEEENERLKQRTEESKAAKDAEIKALQSRLTDLNEYKRTSEEAQRNLDEVQKSLEERIVAEKEKASETAIIRSELAALAQKMEKNQAPWWKKLFAAPTAE